MEKNLRLYVGRSSSRGIDPRKCVYVRRDIPFIGDVKEVENEVVNLYPDVQFETFEGFGGAFTDAAAYVYSLMNRQQKRKLLEAYFAEDQMNYRMVRIPMDSCDFSTGIYEAMSDPEDTELASFSFARTEKYIIPMLRDAEAVAGRKIPLMLSPWSPPAFMKTNGSREFGGSLKPEYADLWAAYMCRYMQEFLDRGFLVERVSIQNETHAATPWDSCLYTAEQEKDFLENHLFPTMKRRGLDDIEIFIMDHNKERAFERTEQVISGKAADMVAGVACHWYSGDHFEALELIRRFYPDLTLIISESCIENYKFAGHDSFVAAASLSHEIIGDLDHGLTAFYDWNVLLDEKGGPNYVGNYCQAPFQYDTVNKSLMPQKVRDHIYQFSHFIRPGARRIAFTKYTDRLDMTAFRNPDGTIVVVWLNRSDAKLPVHIRLDGETAAFSLAPESIVTGVIE